MKKFIIFLLFFLKVFVSTGQIQLPDSILHKDVCYQVHYLSNIAIEQKKIDSTLYMVRQALALAEDCQDVDEKIRLHFIQGYYLHFRGDEEKSKDILLKVLSEAEKHNNLTYEYKASGMLGKVYGITGDFDSSIKYYKKALDISIQQKDSLKIADSYNNLGDGFKTLDENKKAKKYFLLALNIYNKIKVPEEEKKITYQNLARVSDSLKNINFYLDKAYKIVQKEGSPQKSALFFLTKGDALNTKKFINEAGLAFNRAYQIADSIDYDMVKEIALIGMGQIYNQTHRYQDAIQVLEIADRQPIENDQNRIILMGELIDAYKNTYKYKKALNLSEKLLRIKDSLAASQSKASFAEFDSKFKTVQKDKEIAQQKLQLANEKNKRKKYIFVGLLLLLLSFIGFQWRNNRQKRKKLLAETQLQNEKYNNELRTKFLGNIAHEIRTPLTLISGNLELAKENIDNKERIIQNIDIALANSKKVVDDANEILELLKFEKNKIVIDQKTVNLNHTLKRIFFSYASLAELKHIKLVFKSVIPENFFTKIDINKTERILNNLISNAIKYSPANSDVVFEASVENDMLTVNVIDHGQGIHFDETQKIFQRFYQASNSQSIGGIGIGLSLAKEYAELLGGSLSVKSVLHKGSVFTLKLPVKQVKSSTEGVESNHELELVDKQSKVSDTEKSNQLKPEFSKQKPNVLIVEDNPEMNAYLVEILNKYYNCFTAFDGLEALEILKKQRVDLIASDIMMPNLDGFQFREKLIKDEKLKNIPFILISAKTLVEDKIKGFQLGINDYIIKPFNNNELLARIKNLLQNKLDREQWVLEHADEIVELAPSQDRLLKKIQAIAEENISDESYKVAQLASEIGYSQRQLTRILKQYTGLSPVKFILEVRLQRAYLLLQKKVHFNLSEVRYDVGITSASYFNKKFKERFGISPGELVS